MCVCVQPRRVFIMNLYTEMISDSCGNWQFQDTLPVSMVHTSEWALMTMKEMLTQLSLDAEAVEVLDRDVSETSGAPLVASSESSSTESKVVTPCK